MRLKRQQMDRLFALARRAPPTASNATTPALSPGFATRVAARWAAGEAGIRLADVWEPLCWRGVVVAGAICLGAFVYSVQIPEPTAFDLILDTPMSDSVTF